MQSEISVQGRVAGSRPLSKIKLVSGNRLLLAISIFVVAFILICAVAPGWIAPYEPTDMRLDAILQAPSAAHLFGTDQFGRDVFTLVIYGCRQSLLIGASSVLVGGLIGGFIGLLSGYAGKFVDTALMRMIDILMTIPGMLLAIAISAALGASLTNIIIAVSAASIPKYARVMRSQVIAVKSRPFVEAARSIGTPHVEIMLRHILPNSLSPLLVMGTLGVGSSILIGTSLSFLGLGVIGEIPDWGYLLTQGRGYLTVAWWIATFPGLAITALVIAINLLGDELQSRLDPKRRTI